MMRRAGPAGGAAAPRPCARRTPGTMAAAPAAARPEMNSRRRMAILRLAAEVGGKYNRRTEDQIMRVIGCLAAVLTLSMVAPAFAQDQEWDEYTSIQDGFTVDMPGKPQIQTTTWTSQYRYVLPARIYTANHGAEKYSVTVVDYRPAEKLGEERFKQCPKGAETCLGTQDGRNGDIIGLGYWKMDVRG